LGIIYRLAQIARMPWSDCAAAARVLREIRFCLETSDLEARLAKLEAAAAEADPEAPWPPATHGHSRHAPD
jgi:hypothetical protein